MLLDPLQHILRAYDRAIHACDARDLAQASRGIGLLRASLELDSPESIGFDSIFDWCQRAIRDGDFAGSARRLRTLRQAWSTVDLDRSEVPTRSTRSTSRAGSPSATTFRVLPIRGIELTVGDN